MNASDGSGVDSARLDYQGIDSAGLSPRHGGNSVVK